MKLVDVNTFEDDRCLVPLGAQFDCAVDQGLANSNNMVDLVKRVGDARFRIADRESVHIQSMVLSKWSTPRMVTTTGVSVF